MISLSKRTYPRALQLVSIQSLSEQRDKKWILLPFLLWFILLSNFLFFRSVFHWFSTNVRILSKYSLSVKYYWSEFLLLAFPASRLDTRIPQLIRCCSLRCRLEWFTIRFKIQMTLNSFSWSVWTVQANGPLPQASAIINVWNVFSYGGNIWVKNNGL